MESDNRALLNYSEDTTIKQMSHKVEDDSIEEEPQHKIEKDQDNRTISSNNPFGKRTQELRLSAIPEPSSKAPVPMSGVGRTNFFPRKDNVFKKKESLPFDEA